MIIEKIEYEYSGKDFNVVFSVFPHLNSEKQVRESIKRFFKIDVDDFIDNQFYGDPFLALSYTLGCKLYDMKVLISSISKASIILDGIQNHIKKDLKLRGFFISSARVKNIRVKNDCLIY